MESSFWIEAKFFVIRRWEGNLFSIVEKCNKFTKALYLNREVVIWLAKMFAGSLKFLSNRAPYLTKRGGNSLRGPSLEKFVRQVCEVVGVGF